jgi:DNA repair exonuclease SbcCD ATPase subunit
MESLRKSLTTQMKQNENLKSSLKDCIEEKKKLENNLIKLKSIASRKVKSASNNEIEYLRTENNRLHQEVDSLKSLVSEAENKSISREMKMKRALDDFTKMKNALSESNINSGRKWDESDELIMTLRENIRELETQKKDLITGFKKQMLLIDALKKQKEHLEACIKLEVVDKDFSTALEL